MQTCSMNIHQHENVKLKINELKKLRAKGRKFSQHNNQPEDSAQHLFYLERLLSAWEFYKFILLHVQTS